MKYTRKQTTKYNKQKRHTKHKRRKLNKKRSTRKIKGGAPTKATLRRSKTHGPLRKRSFNSRPTVQRLKRSSTIVPTSVRADFTHYLKQRDYIRGIIGNVNRENIANKLVQNSVLNMSFLVGTSKAKLYCKHLHNLMKIKSITPGMNEALKRILEYVDCPMETIRDEPGSVHGVPGEIPKAHEIHRIYNTLLDKNLNIMRELSKKQKNVYDMIRNLESGINMVKRVGVGMFFTVVQTGGLLEGDMDSIRYGIDFLKDMRSYFTSDDIKPVEVFMSGLTPEQRKELESLTVQKLTNTAEIIRETVKVVLDDESGEGGDVDAEPKPTPRKGRNTKGKAKGRNTRGRKKRAPIPSPEHEEGEMGEAEGSSPPFDTSIYDHMTEEEAADFFAQAEPTPPPSPQRHSRRSRR